MRHVAVQCETVSNVRVRAWMDQAFKCVRLLIHYRLLQDLVAVCVWMGIVHAKYRLSRPGRTRLANGQGVLGGVCILVIG